VLRLPRLAPLLVVGVCWIGCGDDAPSRGSVDASTGDATDAASDAPTDATDASDDTADVTPDAPTPDAAGDVTDTSPDVPPDVAPDADPDAATDTDAPDTRPPDCPDLPDFDYSCTGSDPGTCPEGLCLFGQCLAPVVNPDRWASCGDGTCDPCEVPELCPVDCLPAPTLRRPRRYDSDTTITIEVHGFNPVGGGEWTETVYGELDGTGDMGRWIRTFAPHIPDGRVEPDAPNQMIGVEYYGAIAADWVPRDVRMEIERYDWRTDGALHRYALVVAAFIPHIMAETGATDVNLFCHSMGCHVTRYLIENDLGGIASSGVIARWSTTTGVIAGARLARLFDNPTVQTAAELLRMNTADFIHMNPDYVTDHVAWWDHDPHAANNPLFEGMLIHHLLATDPTLAETFDLVPLLDLDNPDDEPNDGLVYTWDEAFTTQDEAIQHVTVEGERIAPTASYQNVDHFEVKETIATGILHAAALYHRRKVTISLVALSLSDDLEQNSIVDVSNQGTPPADISFATTVSYDPYITETFAQPGFVHTQSPEDRSTPLIEMLEGHSTSLDLTVFEGPVFDDQTSLTLDFELLEMDWYPRFGVTEWAFDPHERLLRFTGEVPLVNDTLVVQSGEARAELRVRVHTLY